MTAVPTGAAAPTPWLARLNLRLEAGPDRTVMRRLGHSGPLVVQRPFYPEGHPCHVYVLHPPGGIAGGDDLKLQVVLEPGSHGLLTTPAATKFYRALPGTTSSLSQELCLRGATLEWLPQENIYFSGANARTRTCVMLDANSRFLGWEMSCLGRPASDAPFSAGTLRQSLEVWCGGKPLLLDRLLIEAESPSRTAQWGLAASNTLATLLCFPGTEAQVHAVRALVASGLFVSASLVDGVLNCRILGSSGESVRQHLSRLWGVLRPLVIGRQAVAPRIWST